MQDLRILRLLLEKKTILLNDCSAHDDNVRDYVKDDSDVLNILGENDTKSLMINEEFSLSYRVSHWTSCNTNRITNFFLS